MINPPRSPQTDEQGLARKTIMLENSQASFFGWIELFLNNWCTPTKKPSWYGPPDPNGTALLVLLGK
jgi:hypothetical protein